MTLAPIFAPMRLRLVRVSRAWLLPAVAAAVGSGCWSTTDPTNNAPVGGQVIVYGLITNDAGAPLSNARITIRHHTSLCAGRINETAVLSTGADGKYRTTFVATTPVGCLSVIAQPVGQAGLNADSVMNLRPTFRQAAPLDSIAANITLRGGIQ